MNRRLFVAGLCVVSLVRFIPVATKRFVLDGKDFHGDEVELWKHFMKSRPGTFDRNGDRMQPAERVKMFEFGNPTQDFYVLRNSTGEYCGTETL